MIGILGGTFDPVHNGHLRMAVELQELLQLSELRLLPCFQPVHRASPGASAAQRLHMLQLAIHSCQANITIDRRELDRQGPSYMYDTLVSIRQDIGQTPLCLLMGMDAFLGLPKWYRWQSLLEQAHLVITQRPSDSEQLLPEALQTLLHTHPQNDLQALHTNPAGWIYLTQMTQLAISATDIRQRCQRQQNCQYLLPDAVFNYIQQQQLYHS